MLERAHLYYQTSITLNEHMLERSHLYYQTCITLNDHMLELSHLYYQTSITLNEHMLERSHMLYMHGPYFLGFTIVRRSESMLLDFKLKSGAYH